MKLTEFESSSIRDIILEDDTVTVIFNSSDKEYKYKVNNDVFVTKLFETITIKASLGRYINHSIKNEWILDLNRQES
jgi:hypothetical protein